MIKVYNIEKKLLGTVLLTAILILLGWITNNLILTRVSSLFLPMAPLTAIFFIFLSLSYLIWLFEDKMQSWVAVTKIGMLVILLVQLVITIDYFFLNYSLDIESFLSSSKEIFKNHPVYRISGASIFLFNLAVFSFLILDKIHRPFYRKVYNIFTIIIFIISSTVLLAYIQRFPILFTERVVPMSLLAAFCFFLLSWVQLHFINFQIWPFKLFAGKSTHDVILKNLLPIIILLLITKEFVENYLLINKKSSFVSLLFMMLAVAVIVFVINKTTFFIGNKLDSAVKKLKESNTKISNFFENSSNIYYSQNIANEFLFINSQVKNILGYEKEEIFTKKIKCYTDNPINEIGLKKAKETLEKGTIHKPFELEMYHKNGDKKWLEVREIPIYENGKIIGVDGSLTDITDRKRNEIKQNILLKISNALQSNSELKDLMQITQNELSKIVNTENIYLAMYNKGDDTFKVPYCKDSSGDNFEFFHADKSMSGLVLKQQKSLLLKETEISNLVKEGTIEMVGTSPKVWLGTPIKIKGEAIGVIVLLNYEDPNLYAEKDLEIIEIITHQLSNSIERKLYEKELIISKLKAEEKERDLQRAQQISKVGSWIYDVETKKGSWSKEMYRIWGIDNSLPKPTIEEQTKLLHPDDRKHFLNAIDEALNNGKPYDIEMRILQPDNTYINVNSICQPTIDNKGKVVGLSGTNQDITEQKKAENELFIAKVKAEENEEQLKHIANNFTDGMIYQVAMLDENQRKFNYVSDNVAKLYGCTPEEAKENPNLIYSKIHPEDIENLIKIEKEALTNFSTFKSECRVINPDGSIRWSYFVSQPRLINEIVCWDGIEIDISSQKQIEEELMISKEKAEESDRLKSAFLANMSHEIRTPMNAIMGFTELITSENLSETKKEKYHEIISNSGKRLMNIVTDIVDISKLDSKLLTLNIEPVNINKLIDILYNQFNLSAKNKGIQFTVQKGLEIEKSFVKSDETRLSQVICNLLENAFKFTKSGSIELGYQLKEEELLFYVKDTGVGIQKKHHQIIFDRFSQSDNEILKVKEGTGLGLSISKGIIELMGGTIWVESEPDKGSTFYFTIPFDIDNAIALDTVIENEIQELENFTTSKTILIAEDEYTNYMFLEAILEELPFELVHVENGKDAVDHINSNANIDLILMDINMPIMNGLEATVAIRKIHPNIPIIAVTAYALAGDREKAIEHGCSDYLTKPVFKKDLLEAINKYI